MYTKTSGTFVIVILATIAYAYNSGQVQYYFCFSLEPWKKNSNSQNNIGTSSRTYNADLKKPLYLYIWWSQRSKWTYSGQSSESLYTDLDHKQYNNSWY
jgi:hypothetical protein